MRQPISPSSSAKEKPLTTETMETPLPLRFRPKHQPSSQSRGTLHSSVLVLKLVYLTKSHGKHGYNVKLGVYFPGTSGHNISTWHPNSHSQPIFKTAVVSPYRLADSFIKWVKPLLDKSRMVGWWVIKEGPRGILPNPNLTCLGLRRMGQLGESWKSWCWEIFSKEAKREEKERAWNRSALQLCLQSPGQTTCGEDQVCLGFCCYC